MYSLTDNCNEYNTLFLSIDETRYMLGKFDKGSAFLFIHENAIFKPTQVESLPNRTQKNYKQILDNTI